MTRPCPHCGEAIQRLAKLCRFCRQPVEPMVGRKIPFALIGAAIFLCASGAAAWRIFNHEMGHTPGRDAEADDIANAKNITEHVLVAPATAKYQSVKVIDRKGAYRFAHVTVDAQNQFGAMVRQRLCIVWHEEGATVRWENEGIQQDCPEILEPGTVRVLEAANGWPGTAP